jgi:Fe-S-cluster containining protein
MGKCAKPIHSGNEVSEMPPKGFKCKQCGHCCLNLDAFSTCATDEDIQMWQKAGRDDILEWVDPIQLGNHFIYDIWINPVTNDDVKRCPWLRKLPNQDKYICRIHDLKPEHCRAYPKSREHARKTGCKGFD